MTERGECTRTEILSQPVAWADALEVVEKCQGGLKNIFAADYDQVLFTGCGSTYYLSIAAAALYQELTGRVARAVPGGELWLNPQAYLGSGKALLVAVSRSGTTTETVQAVERFQSEARGDVLTISNYEEALSRLGERRIIIEAGQEESVAQTRSFASMYVAAAALCARMAGRDDLLSAMERLPASGDSLMEKYEAVAQKTGENLALDRFYFLGSGIRHGLACEVNLKMKEMTLTHSEPFHFLEFRHGPMSMVNEHAVVVGMLSDVNRAREAKVLTEMEALGGRTLDLAETEAQVCFDSGIPESARAVLYLPILQLLAFHRSVAKGLNPDRPTNLTAVVKLDL